MADAILSLRNMNQEITADVVEGKSGLKVVNAARRPALGTCINNYGALSQSDRWAKSKSSLTVFINGVENSAPSTAPAAAPADNPPAANRPTPQPPRIFRFLEDEDNEAAQPAPFNGLSFRADVAKPNDKSNNKRIAKYTIPRAFQFANRSPSTNEESPMTMDSSLLQLERSLPELAVSSVDPVIDFPDYGNDIYEYLIEFEKKTRPKPKYMLKQPDINMNMRAILVDWLVEVSDEYKLHDETLFLAVNYIDRFLSLMSVQRGKLQLVGTAAMFIASKFEEIYPPDLNEFVYITDDTYSKKQVLKMEHYILKVLDFDMASPTPCLFLRRFNKWFSSDEMTESLSKFLAELTLVDGDPFFQYSPSSIAAASVCLARYTLGHEPWPESLALKSGINFVDFQNCLRDIHKAFLSASNHQQQAVREKYAHSKYYQVSTLNPPATFDFYLARRA